MLFIYSMDESQLYVVHNVIFYHRHRESLKGIQRRSSHFMNFQFYYYYTRLLQTLVVIVGEQGIPTRF